MSEDEFRADDPDVDKVIDQNIKLLYSVLINEGLPDRFKNLLAIIRAEDRDSDTGSAE